MDKKERDNVSSKKFYWKNREAKLKYAHERYIKIKDQMKEYNKTYYREHSDYIRFRHWMNAKHRHSQKPVNERPEFVPADNAFDDDISAPTIEMCYYIPDQNKFFSEHKSDKIAIQFD